MSQSALRFGFFLLSYCDDTEELLKQDSTGERRRNEGKEGQRRRKDTEERQCAWTNMKPRRGENAAQPRRHHGVQLDLGAAFQSEGGDSKGEKNGFI